MKKGLSVFAIIVSVLSIILSMITLQKVNALREEILNPSENSAVINTDNDETQTSVEPNLETNESVVAGFNNEELLSMTYSIALFYDVNTKEHSFRDMYQLNKPNSNNPDICYYTYTQSTPFESGQCDFSPEIFDELIDLLDQNELHKYTDPIDGNGKIIYQTVPRIIGLLNGSGTGYVYIEDPENIEEIVAFFERLTQSARE